MKSSSNTQDGARLDIAANGFWGGRLECTYFDVRVFNPHAASNRNTNSYRKHKLEKKRQYEQCVREVEHASFTPLVLSATGGMANQATVFYKRLASCLAMKWDQPYSSTMSWLRSRLTFSLLRSSIQCIRGARSCRGHAARFINAPVDQATSVYLNMYLILSLYICSPFLFSCFTYPLFTILHAVLHMYFYYVLKKIFTSISVRSF